MNYASIKLVAATVVVLSLLALLTMGGGALVYSRSEPDSTLAAADESDSGSGDGIAGGNPSGALTGGDREAGAAVAPGASKGGSGASVVTNGTTQAAGAGGTGTQAAAGVTGGGAASVETSTANLPPTPQNIKAEAARICLLGIPAPTKTGGIPSLFSIAPLLGPFTAEAFAMLPALEAAIPAIGPLLPAVEQTIQGVQPVLDSLTPVVNGLEQAGFDLLAPLYLPVRDQVLTAEEQVATAIAPIIDSLVKLPGAECVPAVEGLLTSLLLQANAAKV